MRTRLRDICPDIMKISSCYDGKYRSISGTCSNLLHPSWGSKGSVFRRMMPPYYQDGISSPRKDSYGRKLPNPRLVSTKMHLTPDKHDHALTTLFLTWGQFMDHDSTLLFTPRDKNSFEEEDNCCKYKDNPAKKGADCIDINFGNEDAFMGPHGKTCIDMHRAMCGPREFCKLGYRTPFNILSPVIDGNTVYGDDHHLVSRLREYRGGLLKMTEYFKTYKLKDLLPMDFEHPRQLCRPSKGGTFCFLAGEFRVNDQILLTTVHTMMAREHNRIANELAQINPHWDDEIIFQESRRIVIAEIQHITYNEFLPLMVGPSYINSPTYSLKLVKEGYYYGHSPDVDPSTTVEFSLALRIGHTLLPSVVERWSHHHTYLGSRRLSEVIRRPFDLYTPLYFDEYVLGMTHQLANAVDESITKEVINHLFQETGESVGIDLIALNIQRCRDFALPGFLELRKHCGLPIADTWEDLHRLNIFTNETFRKYTQIYEEPEDIDFWTGAIAERPLADAAAGPTIACILSYTYSNLRRGDKFWYENAGFASSFTPDQLQEIRKSRLFRVICDNTDHIREIQAWPMFLADLESNPPVSCHTGQVPRMDLSKWKEARYPPLQNVHFPYGLPGGPVGVFGGPLQPSVYGAMIYR